MGFNCPHCSEGIEDAMSKSAHLERLSAKTEENNALTAELRDLRTKASSYDAVLADRDRYAADLRALQETTNRRSALREAGLSDDMLQHVELVYNSAAADTPDLDFTSWLNDDSGARAHVLLAPHFNASAGGESAPPASSEAPPPPATPPRHPNVDAGAGAPPAPGGKMTPPQFREVMHKKAAELPPAEFGEWLSQKRQEGYG